MKKALLFLCALAVCFCSCSPKIHKQITKPLPPLDATSEVTVYDLSQVVPENAEVIGNVSVVDGGFTSRCDWETVIEAAKQEARSAGGNGIEILQHSFPGQNGSNCHQIVGYILNINDDIEPAELSEYAQQQFHDYVVVKEGDTIPCSIQDEGKNYISFIYERNGVKRFSRLPKTGVLAYYVADPVALAEKKAEREKKDFNVRIGIQGGYAFRTASLPKDVSNDYKDYLRKLTRGPVLGASVHFSLRNGFTLGVKYDRFSGGAKAWGYTYDEVGNYYEGDISNLHTINFVGGSFGTMSLSNNKRHCLYYDLLFGYMDYKDVAEEFGNKYTLSGNTIGIGVGIGYDYMVTKHIGIGAEFSYVMGALSKFKYDNGTTIEVIDLGTSREGLQRVNLKAGVGYYF